MPMAGPIDPPIMHEGGELVEVVVVVGRTDDDGFEDEPVGDFDFGFGFVVYLVPPQ